MTHLYPVRCSWFSYVLVSFVTSAIDYENIAYSLVLDDILVASCWSPLSIAAFDEISYWDLSLGYFYETVCARKETFKGTFRRNAWAIRIGTQALGQYRVLLIRWISCKDSGSIAALCYCNPKTIPKYRRYNLPSRLMSLHPTRFDCYHDPSSSSRLASDPMSSYHSTRETNRRHSRHGRDPRPENRAFPPIRS